MPLQQVFSRIRAFLRPDPAASGLKLRRFIIPALAILVVLGSFFSEDAGFIEVEPGEVAVIFNNTGLSLFGEPARVVKEMGVITFIPGLQRVQKLDMRPQVFVMEGDTDVDDNHASRLTVRANDGSNFYFERVEIHYQLTPGMAADVIAFHGSADGYKKRVVRAHAREVLRDEFGKFSFLEIADPRTYGAATAAAKEALNQRLNALGLEVTNIPPPKPKFDQRVEQAIEERQNAEQEVEVQGEKRNKLEQEKGRQLQQIDQTKNAEFQQLTTQLEAAKQQAANRLISSKREADKYYIDREASGTAFRDEKVTRAKANEVAYRKEAEGLVAKIRAVGEQGPGVLNQTIAEYIFPQLEKLRASPYSQPTTPVDIRHINAEGP